MQEENTRACLMPLYGDPTSYYHVHYYGYTCTSRHYLKGILLPVTRK